MGSPIETIEWNGLELDGEAVIRHGDWSAAMIERAKLVSLDADIQFALKSDHAKTLRPYIDSMNNRFPVDEDVLAGLAGRDPWGDKPPAPKSPGPVPAPRFGSIRLRWGRASRKPNPSRRATTGTP